MALEIFEGNLCTLEDVYTQVNKELPAAATAATLLDNANFRAFVRDKIPATSRMIQNKTGRAFAPFYGTYSAYFRDFLTPASQNTFYYDYYRGYELVLQRELVRLDSVVWADLGTVDRSTYRGYADTNESNIPFERITFNNRELVYPNTDFDTVLQVTGIWGYHYSLSQLFDAVDVLGGDITDTTTTISVTDASQFGTYGYIRISNELMEVRAKDTTLNTLTVRRGRQGSTATAHLTGASVEIVNVIDDVRSAASRLTAYMWLNQTTTGNIITYPDGTTVVQNLPSEIAETIEHNTRVRIYKV